MAEATGQSDKGEQNMPVNVPVELGQNALEASGRKASMDLGQNVLEARGRRALMELGQNVLEARGQNGSVAAGQNLPLGLGQNVPVAPGHTAQNGIEGGNTNGEGLAESNGAVADKTSKNPCYFPLSLNEIFKNKQHLACLLIFIATLCIFD